MKTRADRKPEEQLHPGTVDQELKAKIAEETVRREEGWKNMEALGSKEMKDLAAQQRKEWPQMRGQLAQSWKVNIEDSRRKNKEDFAAGMKIWQELYPAEPTECIARSLRDFLAATPDVDFTAKQQVVVGEGGSGLGFVNEAYAKKPWQWTFAHVWGPEAIAAARTAAAAWLKELGK